MRLIDVLNKDFVVLRLQASDMVGVLDELSVSAEAAGIASRDVIATQLMVREESQAPIVGPGVAIPHATVDGLSDTVLGVALAPQGIQFGPEEYEPVRLFFVLLSPPGRERQHVRFLARICRLSRDAAFAAQLDAAEDTGAVVQAVEAVDATHG